MLEEPQQSMEQVIRSDGRYPMEAYAFLHEGLSEAVKKSRGEEDSTGQRHVTGRQLCEALCDLARERWGMMAKTVLAKWNIKETMDFGSMVYLLIDHGFMKKTEEDSVEDFRDIFSFDEVFRVNGEFELKE